VINLRTVYKRAEEHTVIAAVVLFLLLTILIFLQSIFSPALVLTGVLGVCLVVVSFARPELILGLLAVYLPFESLLLKFIPDEVYVFARYGTELLIYLIALVVLVRLLTGKATWRHTPFDLPFFLFVTVLLASALVNLVEPTVAILGLRQILRFMIVFFLVVQIAPTKAFIARLTWAMFGVVVFQCVLGIIQTIVGEPMDVFLLPSEARTYGTLTLTGGVEQFWDPGSRVFATLGRYDRFGNFLYVFLLIASGFLFTKKLAEKYPWLIWLFIVGIPTLVLTYSRSSWFAFLLGFLFIGLYMKRDLRVFAGFGVLVIFLSTMLIGSGLNVSLITEAPGQTLFERFYESFSLARWRGEYYGLGRTFWFIETPRVVIPASPILGFGPGQFGGGAAAALHNTNVYEQLGLPFGVFGTLGAIDNNWFSLWGEAGTLGMALYLWMYLGLFFYALKIAATHKDPFVQALALAVGALLIALGFNAFTSTVLEIRTSAYYLWLYAGFLYVLTSKNSRL
jgi:hypothetical protein